MKIKINESRLKEIIAEEMAALEDKHHMDQVDEEGGIMAIEHKEYNMSAVQFHPESILTPLGEKMVRNFIENMNI